MISKKKIVSGLSAVVASFALLASPATPEASASSIPVLSSSIGGNGGGFIPNIPAPPAPPAPAAPAPAPAPAPTTDVNAVRHQMVSKTNEYLRQNSTTKYVFDYSNNADLNRGSQAWADEMARMGKLVHDPNFRHSGANAENIFWSNSPNLTADEVIQSWGNSPGHRENMLTGGNKMGTGVSRGADGWYVVARYR